jgi:hypothetical protein
MPAPRVAGQQTALRRPAVGYWGVSIDRAQAFDLGAADY